VIEDERLIENAAKVGSRLRHALDDLCARHSAITEVRGRGLLVGMELATDDLALRVVDALRDNGILIGRTGRHGNVLKIRPPLVFADEHADLLSAALAAALPSRGG
jgi:4-aminobutyrate aminotransferase-like enzyme